MRRLADPIVLGNIDSSYLALILCKCSQSTTRRSAELSCPLNRMCYWHWAWMHEVIYHPPMTCSNAEVTESQWHVAWLSKDTGYHKDIVQSRILSSFTEWSWQLVDLLLKSLHSLGLILLPQWQVCFGLNVAEQFRDIFMPLGLMYMCSLHGCLLSDLCFFIVLVVGQH